MGKLTILLTGLLVVALVFTGLITFLGDLQDNYDFEVSENLTKLYPAMNLNPAMNQTTTIINDTETLHSEFNASLGDWQDTGGATNWFSWGDWILKSFGTALTSTARAGGTAREMTTVAGQAAGIPPWFTSGVIIIILISIVLMIVGYLLNRNL